MSLVTSEFRNAHYKLLSTAVGRGLRWALLDAYNSGRHKYTKIAQGGSIILHLELSYKSMFSPP
mgnify:CR=1 FL=1